jgi:AI-2 transport protein TqsA
MLHLPVNRATRLGANILLLLAAGVALRLCHSVFVPTIIALLLACVLGPAAVWLHERLKIRWALACITVVFGIVVLNLLISFVLFISVSGLVRQLEPNQLSRTIKTFQEKTNQVSPFPIPDGPTENQIKQYLTDIAPFILQQTGLLGMEWLFLWFFILFLLFFLLLEGPTLARRVVDIFGPSAELKAKASTVLLETAQQIRTYIVWRTIINFSLAIVIGILFQIGGLTQPWTWAVLLAILNYIPYLGPFLAGIPPLLDAFVNTDSFAWLLVLCAVYWAVIILEGYLIVPLVMGRSMDLNAVTVMLACLFWELVWGMTGLFLAMPIMAGVKSVCLHVPGWWPWANLMSADEIPPPLEIGGPAEQLAADGSPNGAAAAGEARRQQV